MVQFYLRALLARGEPGDNASRSAMFDASDLETGEVRSLFVTPLMTEICHRFGLSEEAKLLGIDTLPASGNGGDDIFVDISTHSGVTTRRAEVSCGWIIIASYLSHHHPTTHINQQRKILEEVSALSVYLTSQERAVVATVVATCLMSFVIPQCNYLNFLQSYYLHPQHDTLPGLDERLTNAILSNHHNTSGGVFPYSGARMRSLVAEDDGFTTAAFHNFLAQGFVPYLSSGLLYPKSKDDEDDDLCDKLMLQADSDLLQILALCICPTYPLGLEDAVAGPSKDIRLLAESNIPLAFQLTYTDRLRIIEACGSLVMLESDAGPYTVVEVPTGDREELIAATLNHFRASLFGFVSYHSHSSSDSIMAYKTITSITITESNESAIYSVFDRLLETCLTSQSEIVVNSVGEDLAELISRHNASRYYADGCFTRYALGSIGRIMSEIVDNNTSRETSVEGSDAKRRKTVQRGESVCVALLNACRPLFYFLLDEGTDEMNVTELEAKEKLIKDLHKFLLHPTFEVVTVAAKCLALALSYSSDRLSRKENVRHLFKVTRRALDSLVSSDKIIALKPLITTASIQSATYANSLFSFAMTTYALNKGWAFLVQWIASACPAISAKRVSEADNDITGKTQLAFLVTCSSHAEDVHVNRCKALVDQIDRGDWDLYKLTRLAFVSGGFHVAVHIIQRLLPRASRQNSFLWLNSLLNIARAEDGLRSGPKEVSSSLEVLSSSFCTLTSLASTHAASCGNNQFDFQLDFIRKRIELLQLISVARALYREIEIAGGNLSSRSKHLNIGKSFGMIAKQYNDTYKLYGLHYCQQTRTTLRTLITLCETLNGLILKPDVKFQGGETEHVKKETFKINCNRQCQLGLLTNRLRSIIASINTDGQVMTQLNAQEMMHTLDAVIKCPMSYPKGFFSIKSLSCTRVNISVEPGSDKKKYTDSDTKQGKVVDVFAGFPSRIILSGDVCIKNSGVEFSQVIAWLKIDYIGKLYQDEDADESQDVAAPSSQVCPGSLLNQQQDNPASTSLQQEKFVLPVHCPPIVQEGFYRVSMKLGCRDIRCGEWVLPTTSPLSVVLRVEDG